jgi:single-strand DNA-binding protein
MSNVISFTGRLGKDCEIKPAGQTTVTKFTVANDVGWGEKKITNWYNCDLWGDRGAKVAEYLTKGKEVHVMGEQTLRKYTDKDGVERMSVDINVDRVKFIGSQNSNQTTQGSTTAPESPESSEDVPF